MNRVSQATAYELGQQSADLFLGFSCFLQDECERIGLKKLFFCTREGVFFKAVYDTLFKDCTNAYELDSSLIKASRLSMFAASINTDHPLDLRSLFRLYKKQSPNSLLSSLDLDPGDFLHLMKHHGLEPEHLYDENSISAPLNSFFSDKAVTDRVVPQLVQGKLLATGYLEQEFADLDQIGFVDIGWRGTIQNLIAGLFPEKKFFGFYLGLASERNVMQPNCTKIAYGPNQNLSNQHTELLNAINVLEFICLSTGGTAVGYVKNKDGSYSALMDKDLDENIQLEEFSSPFQDGVLSVAANSDHRQILAEHKSGALKARGLREWQNILECPSRSLVDTYFSLRSNEKFGLGIFKDQSAVPTLTAVFFSPFVTSERDNLLRFLTYSQWLEGQALRTDIPFVSKWLTYLLMSVARQYKKISSRISRST